MTSGDEHPTRGRVAVFGDVGGQTKQLRDALVALGLNALTSRLPADLTVVQVGDLIHRGPGSPGAIDLVRTVLTQQPRQWFSRPATTRRSTWPAGYTKLGLPGGRRADR